MVFFYFRHITMSAKRKAEEETAAVKKTKATEEVEGEEEDLGEEEEDLGEEEEDVVEEEEDLGNIAFLLSSVGSP